MKYLFFDIECSNCLNGIGKMCEFGYVLTDEKFNIIRMDDIPMCPGKDRESRFRLKDRKHEKDLELAYAYDYYMAQPEFPRFYEKIKELMEQPNVICFAYSMNNDVAHLYNACKRYNLEPIKYVCCDVQKLVSNYLEDEQRISLHNACKRLAGINSMIRLQEYLSRDDALMEKLVFEALCILMNKDPQTYLEESSYAIGNSEELMNKIQEHKKRRKRSAGVELWKFLVDEEKLDNPEYVGHRYNVSGALKADLPTLKAVITCIKHLNGVMSNQLGKTDFFVVYDEKNKEEILKTFKFPFNGQILTFEEFLMSLKQ